MAQVKPQENDVLLGRGVGPSAYIGNVKFRTEIIAPRKEEYCKEGSYRRKSIIARECYEELKNRGGRFLKILDLANGKPLRKVVENCSWVEVTNEEECLEKVKQSLRENLNNGDGAKKKKGAARKSKKKRKNTSAKRNANEKTSDVEADSSSRERSRTPPATSVSSSGSTKALTLENESVASVGARFDAPGRLADTRTLLFQQSSSMNVQPNVLLQQSQCPAQFSSVAFTGSTQTAYQNLAHSPENQVLNMQSHDGTAHAAEVASRTSLDDQTVSNHTTVTTPPTYTGSNLLDPDTEDMAFVLTSLAVSDRPKFTAEDEAKERAEMSIEERATALADIFGQQCSLQGSRQSKRARKDLDCDTIRFLVAYMRTELEMIPAKKKRAFVEAEANADPREFSDARLEDFLRVEGMSPKLGAERIVAYWKARRDLFGDKFTLPITLSSDALKDDRGALELGLVCLLPKLDASGRQIIFMDPHRHSGKGYSAESLLRCIWYTIEVAAQQNTNIDRGFVGIVLGSKTTFKDYDPAIFNRLAHFHKKCFPVKFVARHICCTSSLILRVICPVLKALMDKEARARTVFHNVPDSEVAESLSSYGLTKDVLPLELGGAIRFDISTWIANRYAVEMEEL